MSSANLTKLETILETGLNGVRNDMINLRACLENDVLTRKYFGNDVLTRTYFAYFKEKRRNIK